MKNLITKKFVKSYIRNKPRIDYKRSELLKKNREKENTSILRYINNQDNLSITIQNEFIDNDSGWICRISV